MSKGATHESERLMCPCGALAPSGRIAEPMGLPRPGHGPLVERRSRVVDTFTDTFMIPRAGGAAGGKAERA